MKFVFLFVLFFPFSAFEQGKKEVSGKKKVKIECTYRVVFRPDSTSTNTVSDAMQLLIADDFSEFRSTNRFKQDSARNVLIDKAKATRMDNTELGNSISEMLKIPSPKFTYLIYKTPSKAECIVYDNIINVQYRYEELSSVIQWKLINESSSIAGYPCKKATTTFAGRTYEAWYTREIPVSDGPYKFAGLPGLIMKINDTKDDYKFELIKLRKIDNGITISLPSQPFIPTTKSEFFPAEKAARESAVDRASLYGLTLNNPEEIRLKVRERMKRKNNPIELEY